MNKDIQGGSPNLDPHPPTEPASSLGGHHSRIKVILVFLSFFTIVFCLGVGWAVVRPAPSTWSVNQGGLFQPSGEVLRLDPPKDPFLFYPRRSALVFWNNQMKTQGLPFTFYQIETSDKPEKVVAWYREQWTKNQMFAIGRPSKKNTDRHFKSIQLESLDHHDKRFLSVHVSWNAGKHVCEILATALTLDSKAFRKYARELKNQGKRALLTEGETPSGKTWKRELFSEPGGLRETVHLLKDRYLQEGWTLEAEKIGEGEACLTFKNKGDGQAAFLNLRETPGEGKTHVQRLIVEENA